MNLAPVKDFAVIEEEGRGAVSGGFTGAIHGSLRDILIFSLTWSLLRERRHQTRFELFEAVLAWKRPSTWKASTASSACGRCRHLMGQCPG
jgi:hypothetical protein